MTEDQFCLLKPKISPDIDIRVTDNRVNARPRGLDQTFFLFPHDPKAMFVLDQFNGETSIGQICDRLEDAGYGIEGNEDDAVTFTRELFLTLFELKVCAPTNWHEVGAAPR